MPTKKINQSSTFLNNIMKIFFGTCFEVLTLKYEKQRVKLNIILNYY